MAIFFEAECFQSYTGPRVCMPVCVYSNMLYGEFLPLLKKILRYKYRRVCKMYMKSLKNNYMLVPI